jgi:hypothetical protein
MRRTFLFLFILVPLFGFVERVSSQVLEIPGSWQVKPLLIKGAAVPDGAGTFREFGETYVMENFFVFWGRFSDDEKAWALFSLRDGKISKILTDNTDFSAPDGHKIKVNRHPDKFSPTIHASKRMLYISAKHPNHVYGWNGESLIRVLGGGEVLTLAGVPYQVKRATVLDINESGQALLYWDANKPEAEGWALHDGVNISPLWKEGDPLPGRRSEERIKNLSSGPFCISRCVPPPRLLPDGSLLAVVEKSAGGTAMFKISRDNTEPLEGAVNKILKILAAQDTGYVAEVSEIPELGDKQVYFNNLLFYRAGRSHVQEEVPGDVSTRFGHLEVNSMPPRGRYTDFGYDDGVFLAPDSSRALVTLWVVTLEKKGNFKSELAILSFPGVYFLDDHGLKRIAWESALGLDPTSVPQALRSPVSGLNTGAGAMMHIYPVERIRLSKLEGPVPGVRVDLPPVGSGNRRWFVPATSTDGKLVREPKFKVEGQTVTAADVLFWKGPDAALVSLDEGYFQLERIPAK